VYHVISVGMNSELLGQLDNLREVCPGLSRGQIIANLIREAHANATGWGKREANDNRSPQGMRPVIG